MAELVNRIYTFSSLDISKFTGNADLYNVALVSDLKYGYVDITARVVVILLHAYFVN